MARKDRINKWLILFDAIILLTYSLVLLQGILRDSLIASGKIIIDYEILANIFLVIGLLKIYLFFDEDRKKACLALSLLAIIIIGKFIDYSDYLLLGSMILATYNMDFSKIAKVHVATVSTTLIIIFILSYLGIISNAQVTTQNRLIAVQQNLGFENHNYFMLFWIFDLLAIVYLVYEKKLRVLFILVLSSISVGLWMMTGCNTGLVVCLFCCTISLFFIIVDRGDNDFVKLFLKKISFIMVGMPIYGAFATIIGLYMFGRIGYRVRFQTLMDRFGLLYKALEKLGMPMPFSVVEKNEVFRDVSFNIITGLGSEQYPGSEYFDNLYGKLFILDGLIVVTIYIGITTYIMFKAYKYNSQKVLIFMATYVLLGLVESTAISKTPGNIGMLLLFSKWITDSSEKYIFVRNCGYVIDDKE